MQKNNNLKHKIMKAKTMIIAMFAALLPVTTCGAQTVIQLGDNTVYNYGDATYDYEDDGPTIERNLGLKNFKGKRLNIHRGVTLYISSPELESVSNRGSLSMEGDSWK